MESKHRCVDARLEIVVLLVSKQTLMPLKLDPKKMIEMETNYM